MADDSHDHNDSREHKPIIRCWTVLASVALIVAGLVWWGAAALAAPDAAPPATQRALGPDGSPMGFDATTPGQNQPASAVGSTGLPAQAVSRLGAGYLGGFFLGWLLRKFVTATMLLAGAVVVVLALLSSTGVFTIDWSMMQDVMSRSLDWAQTQARSFNTFVLGYLPSAGAATVGTVMGFRH